VKLPLADARELAGAARRTAAVRLALAAVLIGLLAFAVATSGRSAGVRPPAAAAKTNTEIVVDVSGSISGLTLPPVGRALRTIMRSSGRNGTVGVVLFSDSAVEALPPGTPARELKPFIHFFTPVGNSGRDGSVPQLPPNPWALTFSDGTKISTGLATARKALERDHIGGRIVLISDLVDDTLDKPALRTELVRELRNPKLSVRVVTLPTGVFGNDDSDAQIYKSLLGPQAVAKTYPAPPTPRAAGAAAARFPGGLVGLTLIAAAALAAFELGAVTLRWREEHAR
jgi:von Willebrand factor type A domain